MGILWPHSNAIVFNNAGSRAPGAKAYFFEAGTTTPRTTYTDAALSTPHTHPVLADGNGRFPAVFLDYGDYRERVRTSGDTTMWDTDNIPNAAPTDPAEGVDADAILTTGDVCLRFKDGTRDGACAATAARSARRRRAQRSAPMRIAKTCIAFLWNNLSNTHRGGLRWPRRQLPPPTGRQTRQSRLFDLRGTVPVGLAAMGNSDTGHFDPSFFRRSSAARPRAARRRERTPIR